MQFLSLFFSGLPSSSVSNISFIIFSISLLVFGFSSIFFIWILHIQYLPFDKALFFNNKPIPYPIKNTAYLRVFGANKRSNLLVEMRRIELLSEKLSPRTSTSVAYYFGKLPFPLMPANKQANIIGRLQYTAKLQPLQCGVHH